MLQQMIDQYLHTDRGSMLALSIPIHIDKPDADRKFRASDAGKCRLMRYWKRQGKPGATPDTIGLRNMELGNVVHAWLNQAVEASGSLVAGEMELDEPDRIGHLDAIVLLDGTRILYDYKTIGGKKAFYIEKHGVSADRMHCMQVLTYWDMLDIKTHERIDEMRIAYVNRENLMVYETSVDMMFREQNERDWEMLFLAWAEQTEPNANPESWECRYCMYRDDCPSRSRKHRCLSRSRHRNSA